MKIIISEEIETVCPKFVGACVEANVQNSPYCQELWDEIKAHPINQGENSLILYKICTFAP